MAQTNGHHDRRHRRRRSRRHRSSVAIIVGAVIALLAGCAGTSSPWPGGTWRPGPETYGVTIRYDVPIRMSDGVTLYANVGYPADPETGARAEGTFPVLLSQNPYTPVITPDPYLITRGYIYVVMDVRGTTERSKAPVEPDAQFFGPRNAQDGVEAVDFVAHHLDGSNGVVGLTGCSFLGINQLFTAAKLGPGSPVKAMVPACASLGYETFFDGGIPSQTMGAFGIVPFGSAWNIALNGGFAKDLHDEVDAGGDAAFNRRFWRLRNAVDEAQAIVDSDIPALLWTGWGALEVQGAVDLYAALQNASAGRDPYAAMRAGQPVTGRYQLVVGELFHGGGLDLSFQLQWFDHWLKGEDNGIDRTLTPMHLYELGTGRWVNTDRLPIESSTAFHLDAAGGLTRQVPAPSTADLRWAQPEEAGASLTTTSAPLDRTMSVAGPVSASVYASSTSTNLELIATLDDVAPDGTATKVADGSLIGSLRELDRAKSWFDADGHLIKPYHPYSHDEPLLPGQVQRFDIKMDTALHSVPAGHSLRLTLTTQAPASSCGFGNAIGVVGPASPCYPTKPQVAALTGSTTTIHTGGRQASVVAIPLVEPTKLAETLACVTPTSVVVPEPMQWDGGVHTARDRFADSLACLAVLGANDPRSS